MTGNEAAHNLAAFQLSDMLELGQRIRRLGADCGNMEAAADAVVHYLYDHLVDGDGRRCCALVRCFKTHRYAMLDAEMRSAAQAALAARDDIDPQLQCLTLLATAGDQPEWNDRRKSRAHRAIPLPSVEMVKQAPMVAQLMQQMGLEIARVVKPDPEFLVDVDQRTFNVFHVLEAAGSPYVPAQEDFVLRYDIRSVLGFGGLLPSGELFAIIMFSKVIIPRDTADLFSTLALGVKLVLLPFIGSQTFAATRVS